MTKAEKQREMMDAIVKGMDLVYLRLIEYKKFKNSKLVVMRNGKIVHLDPE